jgi:hypothetical protein
MEALVGRDDRMTYHPVSAAPERAFSVLPAVYAELGINVSGRDTAALTVSGGPIQARRQLAGTSLSSYLDCGSAAGIPHVTSYTVHLRIWTRVERTGEASATLRSHIDATANSEGLQPQRVACTTRARLEAKIAEMVAAKVKALDDVLGVALR